MSKLPPLRQRLSDGLYRELQNSGLKWHVEDGSRHIKVFVAGVCVGVTSRGGDDRRYRDHNLITKIRKMAKEKV